MAYAHYAIKIMIPLSYANLFLRRKIAKARALAKPVLRQCQQHKFTFSSARQAAM